MAKTNRENSITTKWKYYSAIALFVFMSIYGLLRGPYRELTGPANDFNTYYTGSAAWAEGQSPYNQKTLDITFTAKGGVNRAVYPQITTPLLFVVMAPITILPLPVARWLWFLINIAAMIILVLVVARHININWKNPAHLSAMALLVGFAPFQTSFAMGQVCLLTGLLVVLTWLADKHEKFKSAGFLLSIAIALKPTMAGIFLIYWIARKRWKLAILCILWLVGISVIAFGWMIINNLPWYSEWMRNIQVFQSGIGDPRNFNILIGLNFGLGRFLSNLDTIKIVTYIICGLPLLILIILASRQNKDLDEYRHLALVSCITLLIVYHRFYDAVLLVFLWIWAVQMIRSGHKIGWAGIVLLIPFLGNGTSLIYDFSVNGTIPIWIQHNVLWKILVVAHLSWTLLIAMIILTIVNLKGYIISKQNLQTNHL